MRSPAARALAAAVVLSALAGVVRAEDVSDLRVSRTPDGVQAGTVFPAGTETLYAVFNYVDMDGHRVAATVEGRGIPQLYSTSTRLTGSGLGSIEISGAMMYKAVANRLLAEARAAQDRANQAAGSQVGLEEYLKQCLASVLAMGRVLDYMADVPISEPSLAQMSSARQAALEMEDLVDDALRLPPSDVAGRQAKAEAIKRPAVTAVSAARQLVDGAAAVSTVPIAVTPPLLDYTMQIEIESRPAASVEFRVSAATRVFLPLVSRHHRIGD